MDKKTTNIIRQKIDKPRRCAKLAALAAHTTSVRLAMACRR